MPLCRALLAASLLLGPATAAELVTLKNEVVKGELVSVTDKEIVFQKTGGDKVTFSPKEVLRIDLGAEGKVPPDAKYADVELNDSTILKCADVSFKGPNAELTLLLGGQKVVVPIKAIANVLFNAQVEATRKEWNERLQRRRLKDAVGKFNEGAINVIEGTLGEGIEDGKTIGFIHPSQGNKPQALATLVGLIWAREPDPLLPAAKFKVLDAGRNFVYVHTVQAGPQGLTITTPSGAKIDYALNQIARLDYSTGNLVYLSDMEPLRTVQTSTEDRIERYRRDKNLDGGPLRLAGEVFPKGLALHAYTELEYDLKGDYRQLQFVVGINDGIGGIDGPTNLLIEADGKELFKLTVTRKDKERARSVTLNVKDVQRVRITVSSGDLLDLGKHLNLCDAKVTK
jgi:hypothetical protein